MYLESYSEIAVDDQQEARRREYDALNSVIDMLRRAAKAGPHSPELGEAISKMEALWSIFLDDLTDPYNSLPDELRARLISIGLWVIKRAHEIRLQEDANLDGLIAVNINIRDGLR